jgi:CheY-like chemotaxis protein
MAAPTKLRILFADDELWEMRPTIDALKARGDEVTVVTDGTEVIEYLRDNRERLPDLLVLDIMMPEGAAIKTSDDGRTTGVEVYRQIRDAMKIEIPIVISTVVTDNELLMQLKRDRKVLIVQKPYRFEELAYAIRQVMSGAAR